MFKQCFFLIAEPSNLEVKEDGNGKDKVSVVHEDDENNSADGKCIF